MYGSGQHFDFKYFESFYSQSPIAAQTLESIANSHKQKGDYLC